MKKKRILVMLIILTVLVGIIAFRGKIFKSDTSTINGENSKLLQNLEEIGEGGKIISADIINRKTGTGPFDANDEAGNDSSESNEIVRSFDSASWRFDITMALKNPNSTETYKGGQINVKATLPEECKNFVKWDLDSMAWGENIELSEDGTVFTAVYNMLDNEVTIPGKQALELAVKVLGAKNGMTIEPEFQFWLTGNEEADKIVVQDNYKNKKVKVSSAPSYNVALYQNDSLKRKTTLDYGEGDKLGRIYGYSAVVQLYNTDERKGLKGIEYPNGDISFDINLQLNREKENSTEKEDITSLCTPILWNYKINDNTPNGIIPDRTMNFGVAATQYYRQVPYGVKKDDRARCVYNSGNITMNQNENIINTKISEYEFDGIFPNYKAVKSNGEEPLYGNNIGCFNVSYFEIFIPDNEESAIEGRDYEITVSVNNFKAKTSSENIVQNQVKTDDDTITNTHYLIYPTTYKHSCMLVNDANDEYLGTNYGSGDGKAVYGQYFQFASKFAISTSSDYDIQSATKFMKFDGEAVEPVLYSNGDKYKTNNFGGNPVFKVWYITKPDGTNWSSQEEMNNGKIEDMLYFENINDIPEGYLCIGEYLELVDGKITVDTGENNTVGIRLKVKDTAKLGKVYGFVPVTQMWKEKLNNDEYSITKQNFSEWPTPIWSSGYKDYIKSEYDENGEIKSGTHYLGWDWGQSMLILGSELKLTKQAIDENGNEKTKYDLAKNEFKVTYKLTPSLSKQEASNVIIDNVNIKIEDTLPNGVSYIPGSSNYDEPTITKKADGSTLLTWYVYGKTVGEDIEPIIYNASIYSETDNNTVYETKAVASEIIGNDGVVKIGNSKITNRTAKNSITIVNLASYALYKTTTTPVIEENGKIHYTITAINKTESDLSDFQLLDILPYNDDGRGTSFSGNYKLNKIELSETSISTRELIDIRNMKIKVTNSTDARTSDVEDDNLGETWEEISSSQEVNSEKTAFAIIGNLKSKTRLKIDITLQANGNKAKDIFINKALERAYKAETVPIETSNVEVRTVSREISGMVWFDSNKNGIKDNAEELLSNIQLTLLDSEENEIATKETDENGNYIFENIPKGKYKVKITYNDAEKEITTKEAGANARLNSIFNENYKTDLIEELDTLDTPVITVKNVNAGIAYKDAKVVVHYYKKNTTEQVSRDKEINGKLHDAYETQQAEDVENKYYLYEIPSNKNGTMLSDTTEVIYYYDLKDAHVVGKYLEKDNETNVLAEEYKADGKVDDNYRVPKLDIENYTYVEDTANTSGIMELNENNNTITVIYYYKKRDGLHYTVNHKDVDTGELLKTKTVPNKTYLDIVQSENEIETIEGYNFDSVEKERITIVSDESQNVINIYYKKKNDLSYVVHFKEQGTGNTIKEDKTVSNMTYKSNVTVRADDIEGYNAVEPVSQEIEITTGTNEVTFYYTKRKELSYTIQYKDKDTNEIIKADKVVGNQTFGETVEVHAEPIDGYIMQEPTIAEITITVEPQNYIFYYAKRNDLNYVVHYLDKDTGETLKTKTVQNKKYLDVVQSVSEVETIEGYSFDSVEKDQITIGLQEELNVINIYYKKRNDLNYIIHYKEQGTENTIKEDKIVPNMKYKSNITVRADDIEGYNAVEPVSQEIEITTGINEVTFYYTKRRDLSYTVYYLEKDTNTKLAENKKVENKELGEKVFENAKEIEEYNVYGEKTKEFEITANEEKNVIIFYYTKITKDNTGDNNNTESNTDNSNNSSNEGIENGKSINSKDKTNVKTGDKIIGTVITLFVSLIVLIITMTKRRKKKDSK